jgi:hypothetical protein
VKEPRCRMAFPAMKSEKDLDNRIAHLKNPAAAQ